MDRFVYTFGNLIQQEAKTEQAPNQGFLELTVSSRTVKNLETTDVRAIRAFDDSLIFEGKTDAAGRIKIALPVCPHKKSEEYLITINCNGIPTKSLRVNMTAGETIKKAVAVD